MKLPPFAVLALSALVLQTTLVPQIAIAKIAPDLVFVLIVHYALWATWPDVGIAACVVGFAVGTQTLDPMGVHAFCYGAAAWGIVRLRQLVYREHPITQLLVTLVFTLLIQLVVWFVRHHAAPRGVPWGEVFWASSLTAVYTAACAPYLHWLLHRLGRWTGLKSTSRAAGFR